MTMLLIVLVQEEKKDLDKDTDENGDVGGPKLANDAMSDTFLTTGRNVSGLPWVENLALALRGLGCW